MLIGCASKKVQKLGSSRREARKSLPQDAADKLLEQLTILSAFEDLGQILKGPPLHLHALTADFEGRFAVKISAKFRVIFKPVGEVQLLFG